jgi:DnaJ family protein B protein 4
MSESLYNILGVSKSANNEEIKKAYRKLAMKWHPDRNPNNKDLAEKEFKKISDAYSILSDPKKKNNYDNYGTSDINDLKPEDIFQNVFGQQSKRNFHFNNSGLNFNNGFPNDFEDIFNSMNNFNTHNRKSYQGVSNNSKKITKEILINLEDLYHGTEKKIKITVSKKNGRKEEKILEIPIKPGFKEGTKITYKGEGNEHLNSPPDDIVFILKERTHDIYKRKDNDLIMNLKVDFKDIITGKKIEFETIDKKKMEIILNYDDINDWNIKRIVANKGMPYKNRMKNSILEYGNLILDIFIQFPKFDNYQKKILSGVL